MDIGSSLEDFEMKKLGFTTTLMTCVLLAGCLDNKSDKSSSTNLNNGDFSVQTPAEEPSSSSDSASNPDGVTNPIPAPAPNPTGPTLEGFDINKGNLLTTSTTLQLDFFPPFSSAFVKVSENQNCSGGSWVQYAESRSYASSKSNQNVALSIQFRDYDNRVSSCYTKSIVIDQIGPDIVFAKYPAGVIEEGSDVEVVFTVADPASGVSEVLCKVGEITKACFAGENKLVMPKLAQGNYAVKVVAKDNAGFTSEKSVSFSVSTMYKRLSQVVKVDEASKVDILFVIDNSGSMQYEQQSMASRVRNFLDVVKGLDWQIAVTTTDPNHATLGDGRLVPLANMSNSYILKSSMDDMNARSILGNTLQRSEVGSPLEQGIYVTYRAIERSLASAGGNTNFIRQDAALAVVLISDEDESANGPKNDPANFLKYIQSTFNGQKPVSFHSIIARPGDQVCLGPGGQGAVPGYRYEQLSKLTGGVIGDVCATDYGAQLNGIGEGVKKTLKSITLSCAPVVDQVRSILVLKDGQVFSGARKVEGLNLVFDENLPSGSYEVTYSCLK